LNIFEGVFDIIVDLKKLHWATNVILRTLVEGHIKQAQSKIKFLFRIEFKLDMVAQFVARLPFYSV